MRITKTHLPGVIVFEPKVFGDSRGFFLETYREDVLIEAGINAKFVQDNHSRSTKGVLRGLHYQMTQTQGKLVRVVSGEVFDVAVDVRKGSPTFGQWYGALLDGQSMRMMYVPPGYAHGFVVLSDTADFLYKCTEYYHPQSEQGIAWNDPDIGIDWALDNVTTSELALSEKDKLNPMLKDQTADRLPSYEDFILDCEK